jgi:hypothetical protein
LSDLRIGHDSVQWYQEEIERFHGLSEQFVKQTSELESGEIEESKQAIETEYTKLLIEFSKPFLLADSPG